MAKGGTTTSSSADSRVVIGAYIAVAVTILLALLLVPKDVPAVPEITDFSKFAIFYIVAQAIERLLEPATKWAEEAKEQVKQEGTEAQVKVEEERKGAVREAVQSFTDLDDLAAQQVAVKPMIDSTNREFELKAIQSQAQTAAKIERIRANTRAILWAAATIMAIAVSGLLNVHLLRAVGLTASPPWLDVVVTGLAIGAGTQPLHELISRIEKRSEPATTTASTTTGQ